MPCCSYNVILYRSSSYNQLAICGASAHFAGFGSGFACYLRCLCSLCWLGERICTLFPVWADYVGSILVTCLIHLMIHVVDFMFEITSDIPNYFPRRSSTQNSNRKRPKLVNIRAKSTFHWLPRRKEMSTRPQIGVSWNLPQHSTGMIKTNQLVSHPSMLSSCLKLPRMQPTVSPTGQWCCIDEIVSSTYEMICEQT